MTAHVSLLLSTATDESTQTLRSTSSLYDRSANLLKSSSHLVKHLEKADWYDRMIILLALAFFFLVIAFILKRRVLDKVAGGVWWWVGGTFKILTGRGRSKSKIRAKDVGKVVKQAGRMGSTAKGAAKSLSESVGGSETVRTLTLTETRVLTSMDVARTRHIEL
jgi:protein transport protein SEC20